MTTPLTESRKYTMTLFLWLLAALYALSASLYTVLFGCSCADITVMGDCHRIHLPEILGAAGWILLVPAGMWLFRKRQGILRVFEPYIGALTACSVLELADIAGRTLTGESVFPDIWEGPSRLLLFPVHGLKGFGLPEWGWLTVVFVWAVGLWIFSVLLERKYHPRPEKRRITFEGAYKFTFVLLGVIYLFFTADALDILVVSDSDRLPEGLHIAAGVLWLVVLAGGLRHFRGSGWMKGLAVLCLLWSIGLFGGGLGFCLDNGWFLTPLLLVGCTSPMLVPVELFWNALSYGPPEEVVCAMALVLNLALMIPAWILYRKDFPKDPKPERSPL